MDFLNIVIKLKDLQSPSSSDPDGERGFIEIISAGSDY
jgi:hypothetical protein